MGLFKKNRRQGRASQYPVSAFWAWWATEGNVIDPSQEIDATDTLTRLVQDIDPDLTWNFGSGQESEHRLTVSAGGVAASRPAAERWLRAAPSPNETWEYRASQAPDPDAMSHRLNIADQDVDLSLTTFRVEPVEEELRVHVGVFHPAFAHMPDELQNQITYLLLDWILGEDDVERWLGHIEPIQDASSTGATVEDLLAAVKGIADQRDPDSWTLARWQDKQGAPGLALFRRGVRWIDHPTFDQYHMLTWGYPPGDDGLPAELSILDEIQALEGELEEALGHCGVLVARETHAGTCVIHAYSDGEDQNVEARIRDFASSHGMSLRVKPDPAWTEVRHFTG